MPSAPASSADAAALPGRQVNDMDHAEDLRRENEALRDRLSRLSTASLRITESLELETVLQEVLDSARDLTGARYGIIVFLDESGRVEVGLTSGTTEAQHQEMLNLPGSQEIIAHFIGIGRPVRVDHYGEYASSVGINGTLPMTVWAGMSAPIWHRDQSIGVVLLGHDHRERRFSADDEETLVMFSSQAAVAIDNSRRYRDERRARLRVQTMLETSPVGIVLFDAATGKLVSINHEARRIAEGLSEPGQTMEEVFETITVQRGDGREIALSESALIETLSAGNRIRAEEIVVHAQGGRQARLIINATPIRSDDEQVESFLVTLQDLAPLEDLERMRVEFLAMVSHELRAPLTSIKGSSATLLASGAPADPAAVHQFHRIIDQQADYMQKLITDLLDVARIEVGTLSVSPEAVEVGDLFDQARGTFLSGGSPDNLRIDLPTDLPRVMADPPRIVQVLSNLLRNADRNSPDDSTIELSAVQRGMHVEITVIDRGVGISAERMRHLFRKFSRGSGDDEGRAADTGLGLAISKGIVEAHGGRIWAESDGPGHGARFSLTLPTAAEQIPADAVEPVHLEPQEKRTTNRRIRILAVDDDPLTLRYVRDTLSQADYEPILTGDPSVVGELIAERRPHLVLLDLMLPEIDGIELMTNIPELADVPVIFLSAYGGERRVARALEVGADDYIVKPFAPTELVARIETVLRRATASKSAGAGRAL